MTLYLLLLLVLAIAILLGLILLAKQKKINDIQKEENKIKSRYEREINVLKEEISRLKYIQNSSFRSEAIEVESRNRIEDEPLDAKGLNQLSTEIEKLEEEKRKFIEKNKKLWEQSIAIHKDRLEIDSQKKQVEHQHRQLKESIMYASRIQNALFPSKEQISSCLPEHFIFWKPKDIVSGDFYWVKNLNNYVIIVAADCTGHGVPGAFMSALGISFLNEIISLQQSITANEILEQMRKKIKSTLHQTDNMIKDGMDMALCILEKTENKLYFSGANNPLYVCRDHEILQFEATKNPIGIYPKERGFEVAEIQLLKGDKCYMFSDGYCDSIGGDSDKKFGKANFRQLLIAMNQENLSMELQKEKVANTIATWVGERQQVDDILVVGFCPIYKH